jgi:hypothetical protein
VPAGARLPLLRGLASCINCVIARIYSGHDSQSVKCISSSAAGGDAAIAVAGAVSAASN